MYATAPKSQSRSCLLALGLLLVSTTLASAIGTTPPSWEPRETVNDTLADISFGHVTSNRILAYDHHGNPGIAYSDGVNIDLQYARRVPGVGWVSTPVVGVPSGGQYPSLAYDRYERPAISYRDVSSDDLKFAHFDGSTWNTEDVDTGGQVGLYTDSRVRPIWPGSDCLPRLHEHQSKIRLRFRRRLQLCR